MLDNFICVSIYEISLRVYTFLFMLPEKKLHLGILSEIWEKSPRLTQLDGGEGSLCRKRRQSCVWHKEHKSSVSLLARSLPGTVPVLSCDVASLPSAAAAPVQTSACSQAACPSAISLAPNLLARIIASGPGGYLWSMAAIGRDRWSKSSEKGGDLL